MPALKFFLLFFATTLPLSGFAANTLVNWQSWSPAVFQQAKQQQKLILLDMAAEWCHWCHVMDAKTYSNQTVSDYIHQYYIPVRVDHDANPALADRYRNYGWPATVVLNADGEDIVKRAGYIAPNNMLRLLKAIISDPTPELASQQTTVLRRNANEYFGDELLKELRQRHANTYDWKVGGLAGPQKFIDRNKLEYSLYMADSNDTEKRMAIQTLDAALNLIDPEWGGMYQYSTHFDWEHPHFEKIMISQAGAIRLYSTAYLQFADKKYLAAASKTATYLSHFLRDKSGGFYTSQDADVIPGEHSESYFALSSAQRLSQGMPKVDKNIYARENGMAAAALLMLYQADNKPHYLQQAQSAVQHINKFHRMRNGHYRHAHNDDTPFLNDDSEMINALIMLYKITNEPKWLSQAASTARIALKDFKHPVAGFIGTTFNSALPKAIQPIPQIDNNINFARRLNLLWHYTGDKTFKDAAKHAVKFLAQPEIAFKRIEETGLLLLANELANDPAHMTVISKQADITTKALYQTALKQPGWYQRIELWNPSNGKLPNHNIEYPTFDKPAGFFCHNGLCSSPSFDQATYKMRLKAIAKH